MKLNRITALLMPTLMVLSAAPMLLHAQSYEVVELPTNDLSRNQFASSIDNTGMVLSIVNERFNQPIDLSLVDVDLISALTDPDNAAQGVFNATDLAILTNIIYANTEANSQVGQKLASNTAYSVVGSDVNYIAGFDTQSDSTNGFTFSLETVLGDSVNGSHIVGTMAGPYEKIDFVNSSGTEITYVVNDFNSRGFVQVGDEAKELLPADTTLGGYSIANAINSSLQVAGTASTGLSDSVLSGIEACDDPDTRGDQPLEVCYFAIINTTSTNQFTGAVTNTYETQISRSAAVWQIDNAGNTIATEVYGLTFEPDADSTIIFTSEATDINDNGQAVGYTPVPISTTFSRAAALFEDGVTTRLLADDDLLPNTATAINNDGIVVGTRSLIVNSATRTKMFVYNTNTDDLVFPDDFFLSSSSTPRAINNNGLVVGDAESDVETRRRNGFVYDINADTFVNLNDLLACDSEYEIITANDVNDNNEIIAEALVKRPFRNVKGEVLSEDEEDFVDTVIAVKLVATGDAPASCELSEEELVEVERQGASISIYGLFALFVFGMFRRFNLAKKK